jgi:hypothetical protein
MKYSNGEVFVSPKTFYWIEMPAVIDDNDKIEFLKKDIMLVDIRCDKHILAKLKDRNNEKTCFFYNLDGMFLRNQIKDKDVYQFAKYISETIKKIDNKKSAVHTNMIDKNLAIFFKKQGIPYFEKNMHDKKNASIVIDGLNNFIFEKNGKNNRAFLRLNISENESSKVEITNLTTPTPKPMHGYLKDISLNGVGIILKDKEDIKNIKLKDVLQVKIFILRTVVKIQMGFVTRIDINNADFGINYNIFDNRMILTDDVNFLTGLIYDWIKNIIKEHGDIKTDENKISLELPPEP